MEKAVNRYLKNFLNYNATVTPSVALARASSLDVLLACLPHSGRQASRPRGGKTPSVTATPCQTFGVPLACLPHSGRQVPRPRRGKLPQSRFARQLPRGGSSFWRISRLFHIPPQRAPSLRELSAKLTEGVKVHAFGIFRTTTA